MARRRAGKLRVKFDENVTSKLAQVTKGLHGPAVTAEVHHAASFIAASVRRRAPVGETGNLQRGVYVISRSKNEQPSIQRRGRNIVQGLRFPPVPGQALVVSGTYYGVWVERGRKVRGSDPSRGAAHERRAVGRGRRRPFFNAGVREAKPMAESFLRRRISRIIDESWAK
jgi:hypothetical protein